MIYNQTFFRNLTPEKYQYLLSRGTDKRDMENEMMLLREVQESLYEDQEKVTQLYHQHGQIEQQNTNLIQELTQKYAQEIQSQQIKIDLLNQQILKQNQFMLHIIPLQKQIIEQMGDKRNSVYSDTANIKTQVTEEDSESDCQNQEICFFYFKRILENISMRQHADEYEHLQSTKRGEEQMLETNNTLLRLKNRITRRKVEHNQLQQSHILLSCRLECQLYLKSLMYLSLDNLIELAPQSHEPHFSNEEQTNQLLDAMKHNQEQATRILEMQTQAQLHLNREEVVQNRFEDVSLQLATFRAQVEAQKYLSTLWNRMLDYEQNFEVLGGTTQRTQILDKDIENNLDLLDMMLNMLQDCGMLECDQEIMFMRPKIIEILKEFIGSRQAHSFFTSQKLNQLFMQLGVDENNLQQSFMMFNERLSLLKQTNELQTSSIQQSSKDIKELLNKIEVLEMNQGDEMQNGWVQAEVDRRVLLHESKYNQFRDYWRKLQAHETQSLKRDNQDLHKQLQMGVDKMAQLENQLLRRPSSPRTNLLQEFSSCQFQWTE